MSAVEEDRPEEKLPEHHRVSRLRRVVTWLPPWVTATLLVTVLAGVLKSTEGCDKTWKIPLGLSLWFLMLCATFLAGAIRRWNWRHMLVMLGFALLAQGWEWVSRKAIPEVPFPWDLPVQTYVVPLFLGLGEWLLMKGRSLRTLGAVLAAVAAACCLIPLIRMPIKLAALGPQGFPSNWWYDVEWLVSIPLETLVTWVAISWALRAGAARGRRPLLWAGGAAGVCIVGFPLFFLVGLPSLAERSLESHGPLPQKFALVFCRLFGGRSGEEAIWRAFERADWTVPLGSGNQDTDIRQSLLFAIEASETPQAARMARVLQEQPVETLALYSAMTVAHGGRQEVAPILLWYALTFSSPEANDQCGQALEQMDLPWAAPALLYRIAADREARHEDTTDPSLTAGERAKLTRWLGKDIGEKYQPWAASAAQLLAQTSARYPAAFRQEMDTVVRIASRYRAARTRHDQAQGELLVQKLQLAGMGELAPAMRRIWGELPKYCTASALDVERVFMRMFPDIRERGPSVHRLIESAQADMAVSRPVWRKEGVAALEKEVDRYAREVDEKIALLLPSPTNPATRPATNPSGLGD